MFTIVDENRPHAVIKVFGVGGRPPRPIRRQYLSEIVEPRAEEIFSLMRKEILRSGYEDSLGAGVVLTGGGSMLDGLTELGERVFRCPVRRGSPIGIGGLVEVVNRPSCATGAGLVLYGARAAENVVTRSDVPEERGFLGRVRRYLSEFF